MTYGSMRLIMFSRKEFEHMVSQRFDYPKGLNGTMEFSFDLPTFDAVDIEYARCLELGVQSVMPPTTEPWGQRTAYIADPDGNLIEISSFTESVKKNKERKHTRWMTNDRNTGMPTCLGKRKPIDISSGYMMKGKVSKNLPKYLNVIREGYVLD